MHQLRRPIPKSEFSINLWSSILKFQSFMSIFLNSALLAFNSKSVDALAKVMFGTNPYLRFKNYEDSFYDYDGYSI